VGTGRFIESRGITVTFFKNTTLADGDALQVYLGTVLVAEGWTEYALNTTPGQPAATGRAGRESIFQAPDTADHPGRHWIGFHRANETLGNTAAVKIGLMAFTGAIVRQIQSIIRGTPNASTVMEVQTTEPHTFQTGQLAIVNGTLNAALNELNSPSSVNGGAAETTPNTITVVSSDVFRMTSIGSGNVSNPGAGGYAVSVFNPVGGRANINNVSSPNVPRICLSADNACSVYGWVDTQRICGVIIQGTTYKPFYLGLLARTEHVQEEGSSCGRLTAPVTGDGTTKTINLDRSCPKLYAGQPLWFVDQGSARPDVAGYQSSLHTTTIVAVNSDTQITAVVPNGVTYPAGTVVGWDPYPLIAYSDGKSTSSAAMDSVTVYATHEADGTRTTGYIGQSGTIVACADNEANVDPGGDGFYHAYDILVDKTSGVTSSRGPMIGWLACARGAQTTFDIMRGGAASAAPANDWMAFIHTTTVPPGNTCLIVGPGAA
jgi:hypothetical protein